VFPRLGNSSPLRGFFSGRSWLRYQCEPRADAVTNRAMSLTWSSQRRRRGRLPPPHRLPPTHYPYTAGASRISRQRVRCLALPCLAPTCPGGRCALLLLLLLSSPSPPSLHAHSLQARDTSTLTPPGNELSRKGPGAERVDCKSPGCGRMGENASSRVGVLRRARRDGVQP
jgi:hypothetical protein